MTLFSPRILKWGSVPPITNSQCSKSFMDLQKNYGNESITESMTCSATIDGRSPCHGDSGGPFVCQSGTKAVITGIVSWGNDECSGVPAVYTRVTKFLSWIESNMVCI